MDAPPAPPGEDVTAEFHATLSTMFQNWATTVGWKTILSFASIPVVASLIGYGTNVLAIQMTFLPLEYIGFWEAGFRQCGFSFGWQGIIPANAERIARKTIDMMTTQLVSSRARPPHGRARTLRDVDLRWPAA